MAPYVEGPYLVEDQPDGSRKVVGYAPQAQSNTVITKRANPTEQRGDELKNQLTQAQINKMIADMNKPDAEDKPKLPVGYRMKADGTAELIPGVAAPGSNGAGKTDKAGAYNSVIDQINRTYELYNQSIGKTDGIAGLMDYLPTEANAMFDTAGAALGDQGNAAFKVPGMGAQSDADAARFVAANQPQASDRDGAALEKLRALRQRLEANMRAVGLPTPEFNYGLDGTPLQPQSNQDSPAGALPNQGTGPDTTDRSALFGTPATSSQNGGFAAYGSTSRMEPNPQFRGMNEAVKGMIIAGIPTPQIKAFMNEKGIAGDATTGIDEAATYFRKTGKTNFGVSVENMSVPMSGMQQFMNNAPQTRAGTVATFAGNAGGLGIPQMLAGDEAFDYLRAQEPGYALLGDVAGMIGGTQLLRMGGKELTNATIKGLGNTGRQGLLGRKGGVLLNKFANKRGGEFNRQLLADASFGATYGATTQGDPVTGALSAGLGSAGGQIVGKGISNAIGGVGSKGVQYLTDKGVPLSLGQTLGNNGIIGRNLQRMEQWPVVGDMLAANGREAQDRVYDLALRDAVAPTGRTLVGRGDDALVNAQGIKNTAYDNALDGVNAPADLQYLQGVAPYIRGGQGIRGEIGGEFGDVVSGKLRPAFDANRTLDGKSAQEFFQQSNRHAADFQQKGAFGEDAADYLRGINGATEDMIARSNPGAIEKLRAANTVNARLTPIENATNTANGKTPTPLQLRRAITNNTKNYGGRAAAARGDNVPDVVNYAADILPQTIRDSGTGGNVMLQSLLPFAIPTALGAGAATAGTFGEDPKTAGILAVLAAMSTKTGAKALQKTLVSRPEPLKRGGQLLGGRRARMVTGGLGTGLALPFFE